MSTYRMHHSMLLGLLFGLAALILGCNVAGLTAAHPPRWACPSPTPKPYGPAGPIKERIPLPTATPSGPQDEQNVYYQEWEQEYPDQGPPFPSPTPYGIVGTNYTFGQRVEIWPFHVTVTARPGPTVTLGGVPVGTQEVYYINLTWINHTADAVPIDYRARVVLRAVTDSAGRDITDSNWALTKESLEASGMAAPPDTIPSGASQVTIPIIGPPGTPKTVDLRFLSMNGDATNGPTATPAPNTDLHNTSPQWLTVQWTDARIGIGPTCGNPGALTGWSNGDGVAWGNDVLLGIAAPSGASRLIQIVLNQVGKPYSWGAKGPEAFDCSGLATWSYGQIGLRIPQGTAGQWPNMTPVDSSHIQPGDLVFFTIDSTGIDHVGILIGDLNGDGTWDMVHAANPQLGVRVDYNIFASAYYRPRIVGFRTAR